ncbi:glycosyltransferase family 2 protein, partial [Candidatus Sumerlaeota bacterium]|nr:glycosyltransferase family 2 protein [Candidatus Sumerlaeota bacterium]
MNDTGSIGGVESVSVLVPCLNDADTIAGFLCELRRTLDILQQPSEIIVIDRGSTDDTVALAQKHGAQVLVCKEYSYGRALKAGIQACVGDYVITMHPDLSHNPAVVRELVLRRREADVLVASRYIHSGYAWMPMVRLLLSRTLNRLLSFVLGMPFRDMTSSFRLYRRAALNAMEMQGDGYALLLEILVRLYSSGCRVLEIPFHYWAPSTGYKWPVAVRLACDYLRTLLAMWRLRNSIESADYDERAFDSRIPLQRYWQRKRYRTVVSMVNHASTILDVGCGSSKILDALPQSVALDLRTEKLRYKKTAARKSICASVLA